MDDYLVGRSRKFIVESYDDLAALRYLLVAPTEAEIRQFRNRDPESYH